MPFSCDNIVAFMTNKNINDTNTQKNKENFDAVEGIPHYTKYCFSHGRAPYVTLNASVTVEASLVMPLFVFAIVSLIQMMILMNVQLKMQSALYHQTMKAAGYSFLAESVEQCLPDEIMKEDYRTAVSIVENGITELLVKHMVINELGDDFFEMPWICGGEEGINVIFSLSADERDIDVILSYDLKLMYNFFGIGRVPVTARAVLSKWTGVTRLDKTDSSEEDKGNVYITKSGTVYHIYKDCTYLFVKLTKIKYSDVESKRNASGGKYYPCSACIKNISEPEYVYVSQYGECYHSDEKCKRIYRNIIEVSADEVSGRSICSKCSDRKSGQSR